MIWCVLSFLVGVAFGIWVAERKLLECIKGKDNDRA